MPISPVITSNYQASVGETVRASGTLVVVLPTNVDADAELHIRQVGVGVITVMGHVNGVANGTTITTQHSGITFQATGSDKWITLSDSGASGAIDGGTA